MPVHHQPGHRFTRWITRQAAHAALVAVALTVAACGGSVVDPRDGVAANNAVSGLQGARTGQSAEGTENDSGDPANPADPPSGSASRPGASPADATQGPRPEATSKGASAGSTVTQGNCAGFTNQTGISSSTITLGNASDVSGPIPGLFSSAPKGAAAYVAYFNATNPRGICGRKLALETADTRTDAGADNAAAAKLCGSTFAGVGSLAAFDAGGAATAQACGYPDMRAFATQAARNSCSTCFGAQSIGNNNISKAIFSYWTRIEPAATKKAALLYINAGAAADNARLQTAIGKKLGMNWVYTAPVDTAEFSYGAYVQQMKTKGVEFAYFIGAYQQSVRMAKAMEEAGFKPTVAYYTPGVYDPGFIKSGGSAVEGSAMYINFTPLEESQPELDLYKKWLRQVSPGAAPSYYGIYAWSAAKLLVEKALALGGRLDRKSLVNALRQTSNWTAAGMHAPMAVGSKIAPSCIRFLKVSSGRFVPADSGRYLCDGVATS